MQEMFRFGMRAVHQKGLEHALAEAARYGFSVLEIHCSSPQFLSEQYSAGQLGKIKYLAKRLGVSLQTHARIGQSLLAASGIMRKAEMQELRQLARFSRGLGASNMTVHIGFGPTYYAGPGQIIRAEEVYFKYYEQVLQEALQVLVSLRNPALNICIENDHLPADFQKLIAKYLASGHLSLTWDIMKSFTYGPRIQPKVDQWRFVRRHMTAVKNLHLSGPSHAGLTYNSLKVFAPYLKLFTGLDLPLIFEILDIKKALRARELVKSWVK